VREAFVKLPETLAALRTSLLEQQIADALLEAEAKAQKTTVKKLSETEMKRRVANPAESQIKALYDANREAVGEKTLAQVRPQIIAFLRREPEQKALWDFVEILKHKHKVIIGKDVNALNLKPADILATVGGKQITAQNFEEKARQNLYETQIEIYDQASDVLEQTVYSALISAEAKRLGVQPEDFIVREITDKMKDYSQEERAQLESALQKRLFEKYKAKILLREPAPFAQKISVDDDPARGNPKAPVTVVMFTDFQCPACSATHPVLENVLTEYGDKVRFVVRDFPLTQIHANSFNAAQAAGAANAQGKFF
jgi:thiol-disulfide isomerase/thioredoxin